MADMVPVKSAELTLLKLNYEVLGGAVITKLMAMGKLE
jgi:hypothetical protein